MAMALVVSREKVRAGRFWRRSELGGSSCLAETISWWGGSSRTGIDGSAPLHQQDARARSCCLAPRSGFLEYKTFYSSLTLNLISECLFDCFLPV